MQEYCGLTDNQDRAAIESLLISFKNCFIFIHIFSMWGFWLNICIHICFVPAKVKDDVKSSVTGATDGCVLPCGCL